MIRRVKYKVLLPQTKPTLQAFKKRSMTKAFKIRLYQSSISPVVLFGCEALTFGTAEEQKLFVLERKFLRRLHGPTMDHDSRQWRMLKNREI